MSKSSKPDSWLPLYIADYLGDTGRFSTEQHGAYLLIIMDYWRNGPPPDDDRVLAEITKLSPAKWRAHRALISAKFQVRDGAWTHKRIERELGKAREMQTALSERGKAGAAARWGSDDASANASGNGGSNATGMQQAMPKGMPGGVLADAPSPSPTPLTPTASPTPPPAPVAHARAGEIAVLLRKLAGAKGKTVRIASIEKKVIAWAEKGVTDEQLTAAFELALQDREAKRSADAITPGFVDVFLGKLLNPHETGSRVVEREWHETHAGVLAKAREFGYEPKPDDDPRWLKCVVAVRIGGDHWPWIDPKNETQQRWIAELRKEAERAA